MSAPNPAVRAGANPNQVSLTLSAVYHMPVLP